MDEPRDATESFGSALAHNGVVALVLFTALVLGATALPAGTPPREVIGRIERLDPRIDQLIAPGAELERISVGHDQAEGPVWDARKGSLLFSDLPRSVVLRWTEDTGITPFLRASARKVTRPGSSGLAFDRQGRLLLCQQGERRIARLERNGTFRVLVDRFQGRALNRPTDLAIAANGDLYFTDPPSVYRLSADGVLTQLTSELAAPNGIALSPDGRWLYVSNAERERPVWIAYPMDEDGKLGPGREFADARAWVRNGEGAPDGLKVDRDGNLFAAGPGGIHVFAPDGTRLGRIETGVPTGNVAWGGADGSVLYVAANHWLARIQTTTRGSGL